MPTDTMNFMGTQKAIAFDRTAGQFDRTFERETGEKIQNIKENVAKGGMDTYNFSEHPTSFWVNVQGNIESAQLD